MDAVVYAAVMRVLLFVLHVCLLRECDDASQIDGNARVELVEYVRCVCVWLGAAWVERG